MPPATSADALSQMTQAQSQMQSPDQLLQGQEQQLGVPQAQQQVSGLRQAIANTTNLLNNVAPSVEGRTANSLVTSAQANRQIQNESAPIAKTLSDQTGKEGQASADLKDLMSQASTNASLKEQGQQDKLGFLKNVYDALFGKEQAQASSALEQQKLAQAAKDSASSSSLESQKLAEQVRSDRANESLAGQKASAPSSADIKQADQAGAAQYLNSLKGRDGHVSQQTWNNALQQWINAGYSTGDFVKQFTPFINQRYSGYHGFS